MWWFFWYYWVLMGWLITMFFGMLIASQGTFVNKPFNETLTDNVPATKRSSVMLNDEIHIQAHRPYELCIQISIFEISHNVWYFENTDFSLLNICKFSKLDVSHTFICVFAWREKLMSVLVRFNNDLPEGLFLLKFVNFSELCYF